MNIRNLLELTVDKKASDLHLRVPSPPVIRVDGRLVLVSGADPLTAEEIEAVFREITSDEQKETFYNTNELDFAHGVAGLARFRVSVLRQRGTLSIAFRQVPFEIPTIDKLGLPQVCKELIMKPRGLILVTGPTGSGKSTTMAAMVDYLNNNEARNVITIEDPIEYLYQNKKCLIAQRDLGDDTRSFSIALRHALRHDPDVIIVGEMRDLETISTAISAAETGHLVIGTLHTTDAAQTVDRIIDIFPSDQQQQIRLQLSQVLESVLVQTLLPRLTGGRVAAFEILTATPAVRNLIREHKTFELHSVMQLSAKDKMQTLNDALADLVKKHIVSEDEAMLKSSQPERLARMIKGAYTSSPQQF